MNMIRLTEENLTGEKLSHMTHTEDLLLSGASHSILAIDTLKKVYNTLKGHTEASDIKVTVKVDGAPSFICATDYYGQCFVATKGALSSKKEDKPIARTIEDCQRIWADKPELCYKMSLLLKYAPLLNIPKDEFWQGDFLFSKEDLKVLEFEGEKYITYHPNTLTYAIPVNDPLALKVTRADIGVCWHTRYSGESQKISFDASVKELRDIPAVFQIDVNLPSIAGSVSMTEDESDNIESAISSIETSINQILQDPRYSQLITYNEDGYDFVALLNTYRNSRIRLGSEECNYEDFLNWVISKVQKKIDALKTEKGKHKNTFKLNSFIAFASTMSDLVERIWDTQALIVEVKEFFIKKLESLTSIRSFVNYVDRGYLPVPGEGFAISDINGNVQKFVSRLGFSKNNFSQETVKGWMTDARAKQEFRESLEDFSNELLDRFNLENKGPLKKGSIRGKGVHGFIQAVIPSDDSVSRASVWGGVNSYISNIEDPNKTFNIDWSGIGAESHLKNIPHYRGGNTSKYDYSDTTPVIYGNYQDADHEDPVDFLLIFKDKVSRSTKTGGDEIFWAFCIIQFANNLEHTSYIKNITNSATREDFFEDTFDIYYDKGTLKINGKVKPIIYNESNLQGYSKGSSEFVEGFLKRNTKYVAFRGDVFINSDGHIQNISKEASLHNLIKTIGVKASIGADGWNPCDICICEENKVSYILNDLREYSEQVEKATSPEEKLAIIRKVNIFLQKCVEEGSFITVSLKMTNNPKVELMNSTENISLQPLPEDFIFNNWTLPLAITSSDQDRLHVRYLRGLEINCSRWNRKKNIFEDVVFTYRSFDGTLKNIYLDGEEREPGLRAEARLGKMSAKLLSKVLSEYMEQSNKDAILDKIYIEGILGKVAYIEQCNIKKSSKFEVAVSIDRLKDYILTVENLKKLFEKLDNTVLNLKDYNHLCNLIKCIDLAYAVAKAYNSGSSEINKLLCKLYCGCGKFNSTALSDIEFAPYVKIF